MKFVANTDGASLETKVITGAQFDKVRAIVISKPAKFTIDGTSTTANLKLNYATQWGIAVSDYLLLEVNGNIAQYQVGAVTEISLGSLVTTNYRITGSTTSGDTYALDATRLPTVSNGSIASNVFTASANNASAQTFDYVASGTVVNITPKMTFTNGNVFTVDPTSSIGNLKLTSPFGGLLSNGSKILIDQSGIVAEIAINTVSSSTIGIPTVASSTVSRAAGVLNDNIVFLTGGGIANSYNFNPASNVITNKANNPSGTGSWYFDGACMMNNKMYCWGDVNRNNILNIYDANNNTWGSGLGPGRGVLFPISVPLNDGTIFLVGGTDSISTSSSVTQIYNPISNTYTSRSNALGGIDSGGGLQINNDNIVVTRYRTNGTNTSVNFWKFTLSTNTWSELNDSPTPILAPLMYLLNSDIIDVFNSGDGKRYQYTISTNTWSAALTATGVGGAYFRVNGIVYCVTNAGAFYYYNYTNNTWLPIASNTQYTITSPSLSVAVPNWAALSGQQLQYFVGASSTPSFNGATLSYTRSGNVVTATGAAATVNGQHVQLKALSLNSGDILSQIGADIVAFVGSGGYRYEITSITPELDAVPTLAFNSSMKISTSVAASGATNYVSDSVLSYESDGINVTTTTLTRNVNGADAKLKIEDISNTEEVSSITLDLYTGNFEKINSTAGNGVTSEVIQAGESRCLIPTVNDWLVTKGG